MSIFFKKKEQPKYRVRAGLALGGGGMRGFAHIGALLAFEEAEIEFEYVAGTSVGSLIGAFYSLGIKAEDMKLAARDIKSSDFHNGIFLSAGDASKVGQVFASIAGNLTFADCDKKFIAVACDLKTGKEILIDSGKLADAISASCAVPVLFRPIVMGGMHLVDGGVLNNIPSEVVRMMGAEEVITVDVNSTRGNGTESLKTLDVLAATLRILMAASSARGLVNSSVVIAPDMEKFSSFSKDGWEEMIERGYQAAKEKIPEIKSLILTPDPPKKRRLFGRGG